MVAALVKCQGKKFGLLVIDRWARPNNRSHAGLRFVEEIPVKLNGTILIIGELEHLILPENVLQTDGGTDLNAAGDVCISGLDGYHTVEKAVRFPFARPNNVPEFETDSVDSTIE